MKTLVIGGKGYVGSHLLKALGNQGFGTDRLGRDGFLPLDLSQPCLDSLPLDWSQYTHAVVASAISKIAQCEKEKETTYRCNVAGTLALARQLKQKGIFPIFFSSDYVFDGSSDSYDEKSPLSPLNEYGRQKAMLETEIPNICGDRYLLLRLGKVFGTTRGDQTLFDEMAGLLIQGKPVKAAYDQVFTPIYLGEVIEGILALQKIGASGLYNLCGIETWSRYDLARQVAQSLNLDLQSIQKISLDDLNESFKRPKRISMKRDKLMHEIALTPKPIVSHIETISTSYKTIKSIVK